MIRMTDRATNRMDDYLGQVRRALAGHPEVDAEEVVADVRTHLHEAIRQKPEPVGEDEVLEILERLGSPARWAPVEEPAGWRGALARVIRGPDDWRLAYLCFGLTAVALFASLFGGLVLLIPAFVLARGALALADERDRPLGAERWLVYPALALVYLSLAFWFLLWPIIASIPVFATGGLVDWLQETRGISYPSPGTSEYWLRSIAWTAVATGAWWSVLGGVAAARPDWVRILIRPFADGFRRSHAWAPVLIGVLVSLAGLVVLAVS